MERETIIIVCNEEDAKDIRAFLTTLPDAFDDVSIR